MLLSSYTIFEQEHDEQIKRIVSGSPSDCLLPCEKLAERLGIKVYVVFQRAFQLNLIRYAPFSQYLLSHRREGWRSDEVNFLIDNRNEHRKRLANILKRTGSSVSKQMYCLKLMCGGTQYDWDKSETDYLRVLAKTQDINTICSHLDRHPIDVKHQCMEQGIWLTRAGEEFKRGGTSRKWELNTTERNALCQSDMC